MFIGGLTFDTIEDDLKIHSEKFGELTDVVVFHDKTRNKDRGIKGRGFGFVTFKTRKTWTKSLNATACTKSEDAR